MSDIASAPATPIAAPSAPAVAAAPVAAPATPIAPLNREQARSSILQAAAAGIEKIVGTDTATPTDGTPAVGAAPAANAAAAETKGTTALEIHPESGPSTELGSLKLRFKGGDGQYSPIPEALASQKIEIEVGGKTYVKDLAGIGRLAADGIANARHANENHQLRTQVIPQYEQQVGSMQGQLDALIALNREILTDEGRYAARRQEFLALNSPEQRASRAETALEERDRREEERQQSQEHVTYYKANVLPVLTSVFTDSPTVSNEEVMGRISMDTQHLLRAGVVPPENYPQFVDYLTKTLAPWAKGLHDKRSQTTPTRDTTTQQADADRRRAAQLAITTDVGRALAPSAPASAAPIPLAANTQSPPRNRAEARRQILDMAATQPA